MLIAAVVVSAAPLRTLSGLAAHARQQRSQSKLPAAPRFAYDTAWYTQRKAFDLTRYLCLTPVMQMSTISASKTRTPPSSRSTSFRRSTGRSRTPARPFSSTRETRAPSSCLPKTPAFSGRLVDRVPAPGSSLARRLPLSSAPWWCSLSTATTAIRCRSETYAAASIFASAHFHLQCAAGLVRFVRQHALPDCRAGAC